MFFLNSLYSQNNVSNKIMSLFINKHYNYWTRTMSGKKSGYNLSNYDTVFIINKVEFLGGYCKNGKPSIDSCVLVNNFEKKIKKTKFVMSNKIQNNKVSVFIEDFTCSEFGYFGVITVQIFKTFYSTPFYYSSIEGKLIIIESTICVTP